MAITVDAMKKSALILLLLFCAVYLLPLGIRPMTIPDESRYGEIPREMLASGDWVVPKLNGLKYFEKPVLGYWVNALSISLFGETRFAIRLPSALAAGITALMLFFLCRRFSKGSFSGILAAGIYLTCLEVFALGIINILDSLLTLFLTGSLVFFFHGHHAKERKKRVLFLALFGGFCALAFLVKGFLAFAVPVITIFPFLVWERRFKEFIRDMWIPLLAAIVVALPWCILIHLREGDFWRYFFIVEHIKRFFSPIAGQHPEPFWYFLPILAGGALPWFFVFPAAASGMKAFSLKDSFVRFLICWFLFPFIFFSACSGKLIPYILPCFSPLAVLCSMGLTRYFESGRRKTFDFSAFFFGALTALAGLFLAASLGADFPWRPIYGLQENAKGVAAVIGFFIWSALSFWAVKASKPAKKLWLYGSACVVLLAGAPCILPDRIFDGKAPGPLLTRNAAKVAPRTLLVSDAYLVHALCWFYKRNNVYLLEKSGELGYGVRHDPNQPSRFLTLKDFGAMVKDHSLKERVILVVEEDRYSRYEKLLPHPRFLDRADGFVFAEY
ncbi:MAG: phospholipid carrier-dependent glycosyltransferase [Deltaproteobacteria bacterium]|nr:phospholipid carrier-dependent glycosyltransferase [Deltaproteobacteria bacterium]